MQLPRGQERLGVSIAALDCQNALRFFERSLGLADRDRESLTMRANLGEVGRTSCPSRELTHFPLQTLKLSPQTLRRLAIKLVDPRLRPLTNRWRARELREEDSKPIFAGNRVTRVPDELEPLAVVEGFNVSATHEKSHCDLANGRPPEDLFCVFSRSGFPGFMNIRLVGSKLCEQADALLNFGYRSFDVAQRREDALAARHQALMLPAKILALGFRGALQTG